MGNLTEGNTAKYSFATIAVISAVLIWSAPMRWQQTSNGFQAAQAGRDPIGYFKLQNVAGGFMSSDDLKGKVSVVDLWATWCGPCIQEIPIYNQLYDTFQGKTNIAIVGIAVESPQRDIPTKVRELNIKYPILIGDNQVYRAFGNTRGFPTTFVLTKEGKVYKHYVGAVAQKKEKLLQDIQQLLAQDSR